MLELIQLHRALNVSLEQVIELSYRDFTPLLIGHCGFESVDLSSSHAINPSEERAELWIGVSNLQGEGRRGLCSLNDFPFGVDMFALSRKRTPHEIQSRGWIRFVQALRVSDNFGHGNSRLRVAWQHHPVRPAWIGEPFGEQARSLRDITDSGQFECLGIRHLDVEQTKSDRLNCRGSKAEYPRRELSCDAGAIIRHGWS